MRKTKSIKENHTFRRLYSRGKSAVSPYLVMYTQKNRAGETRLGITVSTKVGGAVVRNRVRRRIREAYRRNEEKFSDAIDLVIVSRVRCAHASYAEIEKSLLTLARQLRLLKEGSE